MTLTERVKAYCEYKNIAKSVFERVSGLSNGYFKKDTRRISPPKVENIHRLFPDLNIDWLQTGNGEMLNANTTNNTAAIMSQHQVIASATTDHLTVVPAEIVEEIEEKVKEEMAIPIITSEIASAPNTNIKKYIRDKSDELKRIYINDLTQGAKVAECVESTSMWPTFQPGDWVFVKFIDKDSIIDGKTYYFDLNTLPTMIRKVKIENDKLRLIAKNPNYGDIIIRFNEVNNIAKIVGMWRSYFGDQYDEIEAVRTKKEQQIDNLIDEIRDSGKRTDRVMEQNYELMQKLMEKLK